MGPQISNYTVSLQSTGANYTCTAADSSKYCDVQEDTCGDVYTVVVAPVGQNGIKVNFCQPRTYLGGTYCKMDSKTTNITHLNLF